MSASKTDPFVCQLARHVQFNRKSNVFGLEIGFFLACEHRRISGFQQREAKAGNKSVPIIIARFPTAGAEHELDGLSLQALRSANDSFEQGRASGREGGGNMALAKAKMAD